jgi:hypothetical protein
LAVFERHLITASEIMSNPSPTFRPIHVTWESTSKLISISDEMRLEDAINEVLHSFGLAVGSADFHLELDGSEVTQVHQLEKFSRVRLRQTKKQRVNGAPIVPPTSEKPKTRSTDKPLKSVPSAPKTKDSKDALLAAIALKFVPNVKVRIENATVEIESVSDSDDNDRPPQHVRPVRSVQARLKDAKEKEKADTLLKAQQRKAAVESKKRKRSEKEKGTDDGIEIDLMEPPSSKRAPVAASHSKASSQQKKSRDRVRNRQR